MTTHGEDRTGRAAHDLFGHASEHQVRHALAAVCAENDEIDRAVGRRLHDGGSWWTGTYLRRHRECLGMATGHELCQTPFITVDVPAGVGADVYQMDRSAAQRPQRDRVFEGEGGQRTEVRWYENARGVRHAAGPLA